MNYDEMELMQLMKWSRCFWQCSSWHIGCRYLRSLNSVDLTLIALSIHCFRTVKKLRQNFHHRNMISNLTDKLWTYTWIEYRKHWFTFESWTRNVLTLTACKTHMSACPKLVPTCTSMWGPSFMRWGCVECTWAGNQTTTSLSLLYYIYNMFLVLMYDYNHAIYLGTCLWILFLYHP